MAALQNDDGWEYSSPGGCYSTVARDAEGFLRIKGLLLKKGGSRRGSEQLKRRPSLKESLGLANRRNWKDRWFSVDVDMGVVYYFHDEALQKAAGVVRFVRGKTTLNVPTEVTLRGRHAPANEEPSYYLELWSTADDVGNERLEPFAVRAKSESEYDEWLRTFRFLVGASEGSPGPKWAKPPGEIQPHQKPPPPDDDGATLPPDKELPSEAESKEPPKEDDDDDDIKFTQAAFLEMEYHYQHRYTGDSYGPVGIEGLRDAWNTDQIAKHSYVYPSKIEDWVTVVSLPILFRLLAPPRPPPPSPKIPRPPSPPA